MLHTLKLLLPALVPSWRFFDTIAPSPRIEYTYLQTLQDMPENWHEFRPRPVHIPFVTMLKHMVWNPRWNESLFLTSCAERLLDIPTAHSEAEIRKRLEIELANSPDALPYWQFRLVLLSRQGADLQKHIGFISPIYSGLAR